MKDLDPLRCFINLEIDVTTRLRKEHALQRGTSRCRKRLPNASRHLESLDGFKKLASEDARIIGAFAPALIDAFGCACCALREKRLHLATSLSANACASS